jgi:hypothetical protein
MEPWMQSLHFGFGVGAFLSPILVASKGENSFSVLGITSFICIVPLLFLDPPQTPAEEE